MSRGSTLPLWVFSRLSRRVGAKWISSGLIFAATLSSGSGTIPPRRRSAAAEYCRGPPRRRLRTDSCAPLADDILFAALAMAGAGQRGWPGCRWVEIAPLLAGQVGGIALQFIDGRVVAIHIVPDRGGHHGLQHGARPGRVTVSLRKSITAFPWSGSTYCFCFT